MTSASELFYNRRSRLGRPTLDLGFDSSPPHHRSSHPKPNRRHQTHHNHNHNHNHHHRHDSDGSDTVAGSSHILCRRFRASHSGCESVPLGLPGNQSEPGRNGTESLSRISNQRGFPQNDSLPRPVLLARERLVQRLSGLLLSVNRRSYHNNNNIPGSEDINDAETEIQTRQGRYRFSVPTLQREELLLSQEQTMKKPPGLTEEALNFLKLKVFSYGGKAGEGADSGLSWDCSICLEGFEEGDELISLPCEHRFHSECLGPWLRTCGDCPYCRSSLVQDEKPSEV